MSESRNGPVILVRLDRIGDLVLTMPIDKELSKKNIPFEWMITRGLGFIGNAAVPKRKFSEWVRQFSFNQFFKMIRYFRSSQPRAVILFHSPWWVGLAALIARVPVRVGVKSQWHSFLFLTFGIRQKRSLSLKHESEYNRDLLLSWLEPSLLIREKSGLITPLTLKATDSESLLTKFRLTPKEYYVVHPGMSGSARNSPAENYSNLINKLSIEAKVVITGTEIDREFLNIVKKNLSESSQIIWLNEKLSTVELLLILQFAKSVVAPSTGVLHLSAALKTPSLGLYSPVRVQRAQRWGPQGPNVQTLTPQVDCPALLQCHYEKCKFYDCMKNIDVDGVKDWCSTPHFDKNSAEE
jgi:heptosyltransferase I